MYLDTEICQFTLLTPLGFKERGAQLSLRPHHVTAQQIHDELSKVGILVSTSKTSFLFCG
jgi:kynureninase